MNNPLVTIIIPTFNRVRFLSEALNSVLNQTYQNWECIVIDDGSSDETLKVLESYAKKEKRIRFYKRSHDHLKGANGCRNYGFTKAKGDYINWFDDDDIMLPNFISDKVILFEEKIKLVITTGSFTDENLQNHKMINLYETINIYQEYFFWRLKILTPSILFLNKYLKSIDLFNENLATSHEFEFFTRIFSNLNKEDYIIKNLNSFLYRGHKLSTTSKNQNYKFEFKEAEVFVLSENLKRALMLKNNLVSQSAYRLLINLYKKALESRHVKNVDFIINVVKECELKNKKIIIFLLLIIEKIYNYKNISFIKWDKLVNKIIIN